MKMRVGYSPWGTEWQCYLTTRSPWWFMPLIRPLEAICRWLDRHHFDQLHDRVWPVRRFVFDEATAWRARRRADMWWEYRAA